MHSQAFVRKLAIYMQKKSTPHQSKLLILISTLMMTLALIALSPRQAVCQDWTGVAGAAFSVAPGYELMLINGNGYEMANHGFSTTLSLSGWFFFITASIEQELGFIDVREEGSSDHERLFRSATYFALGAMLPLGGFPKSRGLIANIKFGFGVSYMDAPKNSPKDSETWFVFRPALELSTNLNVFSTSKQLELGVIIDYTLASAENNAFDNRDLMHFIGLKAKIGMLFM